MLSRKQMEKLSTKRLLAYKNKVLMTYPESLKEHPEWQRAYKYVKEILSTREHVKKR